MSSTKRGGLRSEADFYITPPWCVHRLVENVDLPGGIWLEPAAGDGTLIRSVMEKRSDIDWYATELREECQPLLQPLVGSKLRIGDFLAMPDSDFLGSPEALLPEKAQVLITNPPYRLAQEFIERSLRLAHHVAMLLRLNFLGSEQRHVFMEMCPPDVHILPNRPVFSYNKFGKLGTDSPEYAWMVWTSAQLERPRGRLRVLPITPLEERKNWLARLRTILPDPFLVPEDMDSPAPPL